MWRLGRSEQPPNRAYAANLAAPGRANPVRGESGPLACPVSGVGVRGRGLVW
jgi:hypothetical protein